jgi:tetratricopeptide (TPR) repeat protein
MTKSKQPGRPTPPRRLVEGTRKAFDLVENGKAGEALDILVELDQAYPNTSEVLGVLVNAYYDLNDMHNYEHAIRRLARLDARDPDISYGLAGAYLVNGRPALALRVFQEALHRWPTHPKAEEARKTIPLLENALREQTTGLNLSEAQAFDVLLQHDELRYCLAHGEYRQGRRVAEKLLRSFPDFIPALNNLAQIFAVEGEFDQAIRTSLRVLEIEPENIHALSNLSRLYFLGGRPEEAAQYAQRLKRSQADATERWTKIAEALTFLEDDQGVLDLYKRAKAAGELEPPHVDEIFFHLLAVASFRQGKQKDARIYWQKALKINPHFEWALENIEDLKKPVDEQGGVWAYPSESWLFASAIHDLASQLEKLKRSDKKSDVQARLARFFEEKHPEVFFLAPHLVERGDAETRVFVARLAAVTGHPALVSAAKEYVFGKRGSFQERFQAAKILSEADLLPSGEIQMWSAGEMSEVMLLNIEVSPEPDASELPEQVQALAEQAFQALRDRNGRRAQELLEQALALWPDDPSLVNNLGLALEMQGQSERAHQMVRELHSRFPDYFFGIIAIAGLETEKGNLDQAHQLLNGLMQRKKLHTSEFTALCRAQIQVWLAEKKREAARSWLEIWEQADPDHPDLKTYRRKVGPPRKRRKLAYPKAKIKD